MTGRSGDILDDGLKRNFESFCLNWGVSPATLEGVEYLKMIKLYYFELSLIKRVDLPVVTVPADLLSRPRG